MTYFFIGIGGIAGSLLRYFVSICSEYLWAQTFPFGTLIANVTGCLCLGIFTRKCSENEKVDRLFVLSIGTGAIGSYTTMSTFSMDTIKLINIGHIGQAFLYIIISLIGGLAASWFGYSAFLQKREDTN
jgi:fluoride exporter